MLFHQPSAPHEHLSSFDLRGEPHARDLLNVLRVEGRLRTAEGFGEGMGRSALHGGDERQCALRRAAREREFALGEGTRLIEGCRLHFGERIEAHRPFAEHAVLCEHTHAREIGERHRNDERARAGDDKEVERPHDPRGKIEARKERRHHGEQDGESHDDGRVDARELGDEFLGLCLLRGGVLHHLQNFGDGALLGGAFDARRHGVARVEEARQKLRPLAALAEIALPRDGLGIEGALARKQRAVGGDLIPLAQQDDIPSL